MHKTIESINIGSDVYFVVLNFEQIELHRHCFTLNKLASKQVAELSVAQLIGII